MTLVRVGGQLVDDERSCVVPDCSSAAAAEDFQTTLPTKVADLRAQALAYADLAKRKAAEADALEREVETAQPHAYICGAHKALLPPHLRSRWAPTGAWSVGLPMVVERTTSPARQPRRTRSPGPWPP